MGFSVVLTPGDAAAFAAALEAPGDQVLFKNSAGGSGDAHSHLTISVVANLQGDRLVAARFYYHGADAKCSVVMTLDTAKAAAAAVREIVAGAPTGDGTGAFGPPPEAYPDVPETEALQFTLQGNELTWLTRACALLAAVVTEDRETVAMQVGEIRRHRHNQKPALESFYKKCYAVFDIFARVEGT